MDLDVIAAVPPAVDEGAVQAELEAYLAGRDVERAPWRITTLGQADWAMRQYGDIQARVQEYRDEVALWQAALKRVEQAGDWLEERLKEWGADQRTPQRKSFPLAHGTVYTRESKQRIEVVDEDAALGWAKVACPDAVKVTEEFRVSMVGDAARIQDCVVAFTSTNKATGEAETITLKSGPVPLDPERLAALRDKLGDGYQVDPIVKPYVVDGAGALVPGMRVRAATVTASVTPLMP